jgi:hypothetical protein
MTTPAEEFNPRDPVGSFTSTWQRIVLDPRSFFERLPTAGGLEPALAFAAICLAIGALGFLLFGGGIRGLLAVLLIGLLRLFVGAAITTWVAQHLFEGQGDYEATFRVLCYSAAPAVAVGLPVIKFFAGLYAAYLVILGLSRAHSFDTVRAFLTGVVSAVVGFVIVHALHLGGIVHCANPLLR